MKKILIITLVLTLAACLAGGSGLSRNKQIWENTGISHYRFELDLSCFCAFRDQMPLTVEVQDEEVVSITGADGEIIPTDDLNYEYFSKYATINRLFTVLEAVAVDPEAGEVIVKYDPTFGYPTEASIDYIELAADDELYITISGFEKLP